MFIFFYQQAIFARSPESTLNMSSKKREIGDFFHGHPVPLRKKNHLPCALLHIYGYPPVN